MIKALQRCRAFYFLGFLIKRLFEGPAVFVYKAINSRFFKFRALLTKEGNFKGVNEHAHEVDVIIQVEKGKASSTGRFSAGGVYNTPQLLDQKVSDAKLIFWAVLSSILV